jgi:hypothetical protein
VESKIVQAIVKKGLCSLYEELQPATDCCLQISAELNVLLW